MILLGVTPLISRGVLGVTLLNLGTTLISYFGCHTVDFQMGFRCHTIEFRWYLNFMILVGVTPLISRGFWGVTPLISRGVLGATPLISRGFWVSHC